MQKKLEAELMSIAHSILRMKNRDDIMALKQKAYETYEKLAVLAYIENFVKETPQNTKTVEELVAETFVTDDVNNVKEEENPVKKVEEQQKEVTQVVAEPEPVNETTESLTEMVDVETPKNEPEDKEEKIITEADSETKQVVEPEEDVNNTDLFTRVDNKEEEDEKKEKRIEENGKGLQTSLQKEFGETLSIDVATDMFEKATRIVPKKSLNDVVMQQKNLQIDLNDRISFVKHLFNNSQEDYNRVISQLNTMTSEKEALSFLKMIKKEYNWNGKEIYEDRLILLIERKFN